jgi:hypothetical protein
VTSPGAFGAITDETMVRALTTFRPNDGSNTVRFATSGRERVTIGLWGDHGSALVLRAATLRRTGPCTPRTR